MKYCQKCGTENEDDTEYCVECGNEFENNKTHSLPDKKRIIGVAIILIAFVSIIILTGSGEVQYMVSNPVTVDSVTLVTQVATNETGQTNGYKVAFTANENLKNCTMECYAYAENGSAIPPLTIWFTPRNIVFDNNNITKGETYTNTVGFCTPGSYDEFKVAKFEFFVYNSHDGEHELVDKFSYDMN